MRLVFEKKNQLSVVCQVVTNDNFAMLPLSELNWSKKVISVIQSVIYDIGSLFPRSNQFQLKKKKLLRIVFEFKQLLTNNIYNENWRLKIWLLHFWIISFFYLDILHYGLTMATLPIEKQFARFGISNKDLGLSPESLHKFGPSVPPKPKKAQPQVPVIPKSFVVPTCVEPSFSTVLKNHGSSEASMPNNYENMYENEGPIYSNLHSIHGTSPYLPPPPPPPALSADVDLPLPPPPPASDLSFYSELDVSADILHFPAPPALHDAVTSPPSPVSSSYSELRRAVGSTAGSANYAPLSQVKSTTTIF